MTSNTILDWAPRYVRTLTSGPTLHDSVESLVGDVRDGDVISLGGFHFCRQPIAMAEALARRGVQDLKHVQWGGSLALEVLIEAGAIGDLTFCFSNLDIFGLAPQFRRSLEDNELTHSEITALELHQAVLAEQMNLPHLPLQTPTGSWRAADVEGPMTQSPQLDLDVVLIHAQRADAQGNIAIDGPLGFDVTLALAAKRVLATVEEIVDVGDLRRGGVVIPRQFVTGFAQVPDGAWPTSCVGHYVPDYAEIGARVRDGRAAGESTSGPAEYLRKAARIDWLAQPWPEDSAGLSVAESDTQTADLMVAWLARKLDDTSVCSVGAVSPLPTTAYLLAKHLQAPALTIISSSGCCIDVAERFMSLSLGEAADAQSAAAVCGGDDSYRWYYQQGRVSHEVVSAAQIDGSGRTNNSWIERGNGRRLRLPGQGGMADVANMHRNFILYATRQSSRQLVEAVDWISSARGVFSPAQREQMGYGPGKVELLTNLAVFELDEKSQRFVLTSLHEGVSEAEVREHTGFAFETADTLTTTTPVTQVERDALSHVDPFGVRHLEFTPASGRHQAIADILQAERDFLEAL